MPARSNLRPDQPEKPVSPDRDLTCATAPCIAGPRQLVSNERRRINSLRCVWRVSDSDRPSGLPQPVLTPTASPHSSPRSRSCDRLQCDIWLFWFSAALLAAPAGICTRTPSRRQKQSRRMKKSFSIPCPLLFGYDGVSKIASTMIWLQGCWLIFLYICIKIAKSSRTMGRQLTHDEEGKNSYITLPQKYNFFVETKEGI